MSDTLRLHPLTGEPLVPLGYGRRGPIWPILGAAEDDPSNDDAPDDQGVKPDDTKPDDKPDTGKPDTGDQDDAAKRTDWRATSRKHEDRAKANKKLADDATAKAKAAEDRLAAVLKAAGLDQGDEDEDPTEAVKRAAKERDDAVAEAKTLRAERTAERLARGAGADVDLLLDSSKVRKQLAALDDPTDEDAVKAVIAAAIEANPKLKATGATPPPPATDMTGGGENAKGKPTIDELRKNVAKRRGA